MVSEAIGVLSPTMRVTGQICRECNWWWSATRSSAIVSSDLHSSCVGMLSWSLIPVKLFNTIHAPCSMARVVKEYFRTHLWWWELFPRSAWKPGLLHRRLSYHSKRTPSVSLSQPRGRTQWALCCISPTSPSETRDLVRRSEYDAYLELPCAAQVSSNIRKSKYT